MHIRMHAHTHTMKPPLEADIKATTASHPLLWLSPPSWGEPADARRPGKWVSRLLATLEVAHGEWNAPPLVHTVNTWVPSSSAVYIYYVDQGPKYTPSHPLHTT